MNGGIFLELDTDWLRSSAEKLDRERSTLTMSRNFYILAAALLLFAAISAGMTMVPSSFQPGLPTNGSLWRTVALILLLGGLVSGLIGVMSNLFEQVDRRSEEARQSMRQKRRRDRGRKP